VPVLLFSGGGPLVREDLLELIAHAAEGGVRPGRGIAGRVPVLLFSSASSSSWN